MNNAQIILIGFSGVIVLLGFLVLILYFSRRKTVEPITPSQTQPLKSTIEDKSGILKLLFEQSWVHLRHVENHRFWFTNMYLVVMAGVLAYLSSQEPAFATIVCPALAIFMIFLAFVGLMVCMKVNKVHDAYNRAIDNIINDTLSNASNNLARYKGYSLVRGKISDRWRKIQSVKFLYTMLYFVSIGIWVFLLAYFIYIGLVN